MVPTPWQTGGPITVANDSEKKRMTRTTRHLFASGKSSGLDGIEPWRGPQTDISSSPGVQDGSEDTQQTGRFADIDRCGR